jgi:hypothetical protein
LQSKNACFTLAQNTQFNYLIIGVSICASDQTYTAWDVGRMSDDFTMMDATLYSQKE